MKMFLVLFIMLFSFNIFAVSLVRRVGEVKTCYQAKNIFTCDISCNFIQIKTQHIQNLLSKLIIIKIQSPVFVEQVGHTKCVKIHYQAHIENSIYTQRVFLDMRTGKLSNHYSDCLGKNLALLGGSGSGVGR